MGVMEKPNYPQLEDVEPSGLSFLVRYESFCFNRSLPRPKQQPNAAYLHARRRLLRAAGGLLSARQTSRPELPVRRSLIGSRMPIQNGWNAWSKLVQEVEVADIPCQYAGTDTPRLEIDERIVEVFPLMTRTFRRAAETK